MPVIKLFLIESLSRLAPVLDREAERQDALVVSGVGGCQGQSVRNRGGGDQDIGDAHGSSGSQQGTRDFACDLSTPFVEWNHLGPSSPGHELCGAIGLLCLVATAHDLENGQGRQRETPLLANGSLRAFSPRRTRRRKALHVS